MILGLCCSCTSAWAFTAFWDGRSRNHVRKRKPRRRPRWTWLWWSMNFWYLWALKKIVLTLCCGISCPQTFEGSRKLFCCLCLHSKGVGQTSYVWQCFAKPHKTPWINGTDLLKPLVRSIQMVASPIWRWMVKGWTKCRALSGDSSSVRMDRGHLFCACSASGHPRWVWQLWVRQGQPIVCVILSMNELWGTGCNSKLLPGRVWTGLWWWLVKETGVASTVCRGQRLRRCASSRRDDAVLCRKN